MALSQQLFYFFVISQLGSSENLIFQIINKTEIDAICDEWSALVSNTYTKTEIEALISNTNLTSYYTKTEVGSSLSDTVTCLQNNYMTSLLITQTLMNNCASIAFTNTNHYSKTEIDSTPSDSYYAKSEIDTTLNLYPPTAQILWFLQQIIHW